jgi:hypothetical protein
LDPLVGELLEQLEDTPAGVRVRTQALVAAAEKFRKYPRRQTLCLHLAVAAKRMFSLGHRGAAFDLVALLSGLVGAERAGDLLEKMGVETSAAKMMVNEASGAHRTADAAFTRPTAKGVGLRPKKR